MKIKSLTEAGTFVEILAMNEKRLYSWLIVTGKYTAGTLQVFVPRHSLTVQDDSLFSL